MSAQMVDAYLDELLAPLEEDARVQVESGSAYENQAANEAENPAGPQAGLQAAAQAVARVEADFEADFAAEAAAFAEAASVAEAATAPAPVPRPEPHIAEPVQPPTPPVPGQEIDPQPLPRQLPAATPLANQHAQAPARTPHNTSGNRWLRAALGDDRYAFELLRVQEVVRMSPIIALRGTSHAMLGVMNLRGRIVPVFDLARWLGTGRVDPDEHARIIVVERDDELIGVLVSAVDDVVTLSREHIEPPLPGTDPGGVVGVARVGRLPTVLLDANALFQ
ncbi:purine-binding chemotaxis protein CheW [Lysobacter sp. CW239]|uniref:chemotaxis protein CheW n=1 Tax=Lysobacteraceae TaxID=32033 RepID=UPI00068CBB28|nr:MULTISPECIES: chemotaxis protein CheW [Lysobacter]QOD90616.1 purine-binding chemotaxis protein CheW [Lysobacter sp. CW239]